MAYPSANEQKIIGAAEKLVEETMARYDPSHDNFHGVPRIGMCQFLG